VHGLPHLLAVAAIVTQVGGCSVLNLLLGGGPEPFDPDEPFPFPTAEATFSTGSATIELEGETVVLDEVLEDSGLGEFGFTVTWENDDGWYLQLSGFADELDFPGGGAYLSLHRLQDNEHLVIVDPSRCVTTIDASGEDGVTGSATCRGLQWTDFFASYPLAGGFPKPIEGQEPFDAEITFEAT
jgi:hypothetical protein